MYKHHFGFNENPFSIAPDPRYLFMSERHQEALAHLSFGAASDGCIILLTGEVGTGKTTICRRFIESLDPTTDVAMVLNPKLTADELLAAICDEFRIDRAPEPSSTRKLLHRLNKFLLQGHANNRQALLIVDEAQHLDRDVLEMMRLLTNLETDRHKLLKIVLLGQSELATLLARPEMRQITQRITSRYHLKGLQRSDLPGYIQHRISVAGGGRTRLFNDAAIKSIFSLTGGIPRLVNSLCDRSLLGAYTEGKTRVDRTIVKRAARELFDAHRVSLRTLPSRPRFLPLAGLLVAVLAVGIWLGSLLVDLRSDQLGPQKTTSAPAPADPQVSSDGDTPTPADESDDPLLRLAGQDGDSRIVIGPITVNEKPHNTSQTDSHVVHP